MALNIPFFGAVKVTQRGLTWILKPMSNLSLCQTVRPISWDITDPCNYGYTTTY